MVPKLARGMHVAFAAAMRKVLITGGAGFIGSHVADELLREGFAVRALDSLDRQVHPRGERPGYLDPAVELVVADVRDPAAVARALKGVDVVYHFAAKVGVGQSMYQIAEYSSVNTVGTAVLLEALVRHPVQKLIVASSMSVYGEGEYEAADGTRCMTAERDPRRMADALWDPVDARQEPLRPVPTREPKPPSLQSVYALSKFDQEHLCLMFGRAYRVPTLALRFFNVYGPRQALSNPYTGVLAIFAARLLNGRPPVIFEDGQQMRDFVSVYDVARACRLAMQASSYDYVANVGSGRAYSVNQIAASLARVLGCSHIAPEVTGEYRFGDVRHCFADIERAKASFGYAPNVVLETGLADLGESLRDQRPVDRVPEARRELIERGLTT